ncbi:MAG: phosphopantetheine adenylyltransferase [Thermoplasmata archaeon]|nr:phosphopantetheine adenylyltransferase [Thermoplasmata archaeon]
MRKVAVAGTFNVFHKGHMALLEKAFEIGDYIHIGLTSDEMANRYRNVVVESYELREQRLMDEALKLSDGKSFTITEINDPFGPAATYNYDAIVVSKNTREMADAMNWAREKSGLKPLEIVEIDIVLAEDGKPIASTRVIIGEINLDGEVK